MEIIIIALFAAFLNVGGEPATTMTTDTMAKPEAVMHMDAPDRIGKELFFARYHS